MPKRKRKSNIAETPEEMAAKVRELQGLDMSNYFPKSLARNEGGPGNGAAPSAPKYTTFSGGTVYFGMPGHAHRSGHRL